MKGKLIHTIQYVRRTKPFYILIIRVSYRKEKERRRLEDNKDTKEIDKELKSIREHYLGTLCKFISYITIIHMVYKHILSRTVHFLRL